MTGRAEFVVAVVILLWKSCDFSSGQANHNIIQLRMNEAMFNDQVATMGHCDQNRDEKLSLVEFSNLCGILFRNQDGVPYTTPPEMLEMIFKIFDSESDGYLDSSEFSRCYQTWIRKITHPISVLVIVDVQNDFIDGSLAMKNAPAHDDGSAVIDPINLMLDTVTFHEVIYTLDWHPPNHISFVDNVKLRKLHQSSKIQDPSTVKILDTVVFQGSDGHPMEQTLWPRHAVQNTSGAELHPKLKFFPGAKKVYKGTNPDLDAYSALLDNEKKAPSSDLKMFIDEVGATDVYVSGLATDFCAGATALDAMLLGYRTIFVEDALRGVSPDGIQRTKRKILEGDGVLVDVAKVGNMVKGLDRRPELGLYLARQIQKKRN